MSASSVPRAPGPSTGWAVARPHPVLRPLVARYVGYTRHAVPLTVHRGLPSRHVTLVIGVDAPVRMLGGPTPDGGPMTVRAGASGLHLGPALIRQDSHQRGLSLLHPLGVRALLGVSAAELARTTVEAADLPVPWGGRLADRLAEAATWTEAFAVLDEELAAAVRPARSAPEIHRAWRALLASGGTRPVAAIAAEVGWSRRHLTERFAREVGVPPKQAARLMRFERSVAAIRAGGHHALATVAADCGYDDQAHLTNEWRTLVGCSPTVWIREELPFLQDPFAEVGHDPGHE